MGEKCFYLKKKSIIKMFNYFNKNFDLQKIIAIFNLIKLISKNKNFYIIIIQLLQNFSLTFFSK